MQSTRFIHFMLPIVNRNSFLCSFETSSNLLFCLSSREDEIIIGKAFLSPKNAYSKVLSNGLSLNFRGDSDDGLSYFHVSGSCSIIDFCLLVSIDSDVSS